MRGADGKMREGEMTAVAFLLQLDHCMTRVCLVLLIVNYFNVIREVNKLGAS